MVVRTATMMRLEAMHICPAFMSPNPTAFPAAAGSIASSNTMKGELPPSSMLRLFKLLAACCISSLPTLVDPVNEILRTDLLDVSSAPALFDRGFQLYNRVVRCHYGAAIESLVVLEGAGR